MCRTHRHKRGNNVWRLDALSYIIIDIREIM
jgi:hypothetical protein